MVRRLNLVGRRNYAVGGSQVYVYKRNDPASIVLWSRRLVFSLFRFASGLHIDRRRSGFTLVELMVAVAIIAILAVTAVPQFTKYLRGAKSAEATMLLDGLRKGASAYYAIPHTDPLTAKRKPCQFPVKVSITPAGASCCIDALDKDNDERCDSNPADWDHTTWSALRFGLTDSHYFQYQFESTGTLSKARYIAGAHADLDCDGLLSTFEIGMGGDPEATESDCDAVSSAAALFRDNETE
ncbi:MAG: type II secretion system protein [Myxococcales bacterium]|nr:type II secretion system protein [Myxococcales bacterium]